VLTDAADPVTLGRVAGLAGHQTEAAIAEAVGSGLLAEDRRGRVAFRHALAASAVYDRASAADRAAAHCAAAEALENARPGQVGRLAHHFRAGGDTARWCVYAEQAVDLALASGDHLTAVTFLHDG
jgi:hypothetical protein